MLQLGELTTFLDRFFAVVRYDGDQGGTYRSSARPIRRLGLALEPWPNLPFWAEQHRLDAVFLHRPWKLQPWHLPPDVGVLAYHLAFDERLTLGFNPRLADAFGMLELEVLGEKAGRPIGMIGNAPHGQFEECQRVARQIFGGLDDAQACSSPVSRIAVVGAMTDALVREAAARQVQIYITGQLRQPARRAFVETGMGVLVVGHRRSEEWGLRALASVLRERWSSLDVVVG